MKTQRYLAACACWLLMAFAGTAWSQQLKLPGDVRSELSDLRTLLSRNLESDAAAVEVSRDIYSWAVDSAEAHTIDEVVAALGMDVPLVSNEDSLRWTNDRYLDGKRGAPIVASVAVWRGAGREVLVLRVDRFVKQRYFLSRLPEVIAREYGNVRTGWVADWGDPREADRYAHEHDCAPVMCSFQGFLPGPTPASWPDVLLSSGPQGQQGGVVVVQLHFEGDAWRKVSENSADYVTGVRFDARTGVLEFDAGAESGFGATRKVMKVTEKFQLTYGGK